MAFDQPLDNGNRVGGVPGVGSLQEGLSVALGPVGGKEVKVLADVVKGWGRDCGESGVEGLGIETAGGGDVVEIAGNEDVIEGYSVSEFLREDFRIGFERDAGAANGVAGDPLRGKEGCANNGDFAFQEHDESIAEADSDMFGVGGVPFDGLGKALGIPVELHVAVGIDKEVDIGAVSVPPPGGERGAAAEADVVLAAKVVGQRLADGFKQFAGAARKIELGHQADAGRLAMVRVR